MYQFIHIETYARVSSQKTKPTKKGNALASPTKPRSNMADVLGEALRDDGYCPHVMNPQPPTFLVGDEATIRGLPAEIERNLTAHHARVGGRKVRTDTHVLLAGVASFPDELAKAEPATFSKWQEATTAWLKAKYGDNLRAVLRHDDEEHPHLHFYVVSETIVNAKELHDGHVGAASMRAVHGNLSKEGATAFNDAMREFQSDYYAKVGHGVGLLRDGPKRRREPRAVYKAQQQEQRQRVALNVAVETAQAELLDTAATEAKRLSDLRRDVESERALLALELTELEQLRAMVEQERDGLAARGSAIDAGWQRYRQKAVELSAKEVEVNKAQDQLARDSMLLPLREARASEGIKMAQNMREANDITSRQLEREWADVRKLAEVLQRGKADLAAAADISELAKRPELAGMLLFLARNDAARNALAIMQTDPSMVSVLASTVEVARALGADPTRADWGTLGQDLDWAAVQAATDAAEKVAPRKSTSADELDFGM